MSFIKKDSVLAIAIGALSAFGFAPFSFPVALIASYGWLFHKLRQIDAPKAGFKLCYFWAIGHYIAGLYWIGNSTLIDAQIWWWAWPFATILLPALFSLYQAFAGYLFIKLKLPPISGIALLFMLAEFFRATWFTGFPWNLAGTTWIGFLPMAQNASWMGIYGLTAFTILLASALSDFKGTYNYIIYLSLTLVLYVLGIVIMPSVAPDKNVHVSIVQPNIAQLTKWAPDHIADNSVKSISLSTPATPQTEAKENWLIWPETAQASSIWRNPILNKHYINTMKAWPDNTTLYTGMLFLEPNDIANSIIALDQNNDALWRQNKHHLVPYGEYMPFEDIIPLGTITGITGFDRGTPPITMADGIIPLICYEMIFPDLARAAWSPQSRAIITVTDDSWFGTSSGPYQHLVQAQFRAIETGLPVIRSANTGISAIIAPNGQIVERTQLNSTDIIAQFLPTKTSQTYYTHYNNLAFFSFLAFLIFIILLDKRQVICNLLRNMK